MPDKMPADIRRQLWNLRTGFLHATFTKQNLPGFHRVAHFLCRMRLADRDQVNVISRSPRFRRRTCDLLANAVEIFCD
jgi:hypothetical protein